MATPIYVAAVGDHPTVRFAADELRRYLARVAGRPALEGRADDVGALRVGLARDLPGAPLPELGEGFDARLDDAIGVDVAGARGVIAGASPRGALLATYRYLHALGCRWVRPGPDGEHLPSVDLEQARVRLSERPSYRHRGICIEGAVSFEHVRDLIDWMPKVGLTAYFLQFRESYTFFERWYTHRGHPTRAGGSFSVAEARALMARVVAELRLRDMVYQAVGHGWTCEPLGIAGLGWEYPPEPVPPEAVQHLALVDGRRELWEGIALNTSLCYSSPVVRQLIVDDALAYVRAHPEVDLLHFWLADGTNNQCECERCAAMRPSDWYVRLLNELDLALERAGLATRVVFLAYFDLLWPPEREVLRSPGRFVLMFAPITRTYSRAFEPAGELPGLPPYVRNRLAFPQQIEENLAFLRAWQAWAGPVDSFDFDYHLMWDHYRDPGYAQVAETLQRDIRLLAAHGLDGLISCQVQRSFFPTGLPMVLLGWLTWDAAADVGRLTREFYAAAFGPQGELARGYLERVSALFDPPALRGERPALGRTELPAAVAALVAEIGPALAQGVASPSACWASSWRQLALHAELVALLAEALRAQAQGDPARLHAAWEALSGRIWALEDELHPVLDAYLATRVLAGVLGVPGVS